MSERILYEVEALFTDRTIADRWAQWMVGEHIADVCRCGAQSGQLVALDGDEVRFVAQYEFASRDALDSYFRDHAPRLRMDAASRFTSDQVTYTRRTGSIYQTP